ncbi:Txe/YoeB family addiction module toxin [Catalinimonas sp. 4WD22]|uniref:Txe/YoeB family addiction module toxin n=1 Tax=Catalinimonas locisalis TaxID=3133978 RepID=UPI0031017390
MNITFSKNAWEDYTSWLTEDKKMLKKINDLIKDIQRTPFEGRGKPEPLKYELSGYWSRRIDREHRLVYQVSGSEILIYSCKYHYDK